MTPPTHALPVILTAGAALITAALTQNVWLIMIAVAIAALASEFLNSKTQKKWERKVVVKMHNKDDELRELQRLTAQLDKGARLLIRRDLELNRANEQLRVLDRMKSEFVSLVTHQLRTPLSGIKWSLSMLLDNDLGPLTAEQRTYIMKTYESNERMIALINNMLQADRLESGTVQFEFIPTQLKHLLDNVMIDMQPLAKRKEVALTYGTREDSPDVPIDPKNMRMVLQNLIENAVKYTPRGGTVTVEVFNRGSFVELKVADTGIGIPADQQKNIFKRFFRAPNAVRTETEGSGLGLYIVENVVRKHSGSIRFTSEAGKGTIFFVTLPIIHTAPKKNP